MDIYSFILSRDIAEHCRKLEHEFIPLEMAIIVLISEKPITRRHEAWQWIIDSQPDMNISIQGLASIIYRDVERKPTLTLHSYLADYMRIENELAMKASVSFEDTRLFAVFKALRFDIPVPFKKGDITIGEDGVFVLLSEKWKAPTDGINKFCVGGASNLVASLYMLETGAAYDGYPSFTSIGWEYYRGELNGMNRTLEPISAHLKGELSIEELLDAYLKILETEGGRVCRKELRSLGYYDIVCNKNTIEKFKRAGLLPRKKEKSESMDELTEMNRISKPISNYLKGELSLDLLMNAYAIDSSEAQQARGRKYAEDIISKYKDLMDRLDDE